MSIRGIEILEDKDAWRQVTSNYTMTFFNRTGDDPGVFDVTVSIELMRQMSSNATLNMFKRRQLQGPKSVHHLQSNIQLQNHQAQKVRRHLRGHHALHHTTGWQGLHQGLEEIIALL